MINHEKIRKSKIFADSELEWHGIKVPNYVVGAYYSKGWGFVSKYDVSHEDGLCFLLYWFLLNCEIEIADEASFGYRNKLIAKLHRKNRKACDRGPFELSPLQTIILNCREDLKKKFSEEGFEVDFQKWWVSYGAGEYNMPEYPLLNKNEIAGLADSYIRELYVDIKCKEKYRDAVSKQTRDSLKMEIIKVWAKFKVNVRA